MATEIRVRRRIINTAVLVRHAQISFACIFISLAASATAYGVATDNADINDTGVLKDVIYQGHRRTVEIIDNVSVLHSDVLAFPSEISESGALSSASQRAPVDEVSEGTTRSWKKTHLTYSFNRSVIKGIRERFQLAALIWRDATDWRFTNSSDESSADFIIYASRNSCSATVGAPEDGEQGVMTLSPNCSLRSMVHELGHIVGMVHEHQRPGRERFVKIRHDTLDYVRDKYGNSMYERFVHALQPEHQSPGQPFDFDTTSIMMYGSYPRQQPIRDDLIANGLPMFTAIDGSIYEASPARLSDKDIATAEYLATLITRIHSLLPR